MKYKVCQQILAHWCCSHLAQSCFVEHLNDFEKLSLYQMHVALHRLHEHLSLKSCIYVWMRNELHVCFKMCTVWKTYLISMLFNSLFYVHSFLLSLNIWIINCQRWSRLLSVLKQFVEFNCHNDNSWVWRYVSVNSLWLIYSSNYCILWIILALSFCDNWNEIFKFYSKRVKSI